MFSDIIQWNCQGIKNKRLELQILADQCKANVMCLQETKLPVGEEYAFSGFQVFLKSKDIGPQGHAHGGVAILARSGVGPIPINLNTRFQAVAVSVKLQKRITICSIYIPPGANNDFRKRDLENLIDQLPKPYMLLGDFNAHNTLWHDGRIDDRGLTIENVFIDKDCHFLDKDEDTHVYTHVDENRESTLRSSHIDLSICSLSLFLEYEWKRWGDLMRSDHFPIQIKAESRARPLTFSKWIIKKADWGKFQQAAIPRMQMEDFDSAQEMAEYAKSFILAAANESIPKTSGKAKDYSAIWFDDECKRLRDIRQKVFRKYQKRETPAANWRKACAEAQRAFNKNKRQYWQEFIEGINAGSSLDEDWRRYALLTNKFVSKAVAVLRSEGRIIDGAERIADCLAERMEEVSSERSCSDEFLMYKRRAERKKINFSSRLEQDYNDPITRVELDAAMSDLKNSAPGPDGIHNKMLQNLPEEGKAFILQLFNRIFESGEFPAEWRLAHVIPILKEGKDPLDPASYRPISLTSCLCKLLERIINKRLVRFLESVGAFDRGQSACRKGRGTLDPLVALENEIREAFLKNRLLVSIFVDLEKAYDTCWAYLVLKELFNAGLRGKLGVFIGQFMEDRKFKVRVEDKLSGERKLDLGVPQGSVLSCTLFLMAINTVVRYVPVNISRSLYVDDLRFSIEVEQLIRAERAMCGLMERLSRWMGETGFRISLSKTKVIVFHIRPDSEKAKEPVLDFALQIKLGDVVLEVVKVVKFLGVIFDQRLTFLPHIALLRRKCLKALGFMKLIAKKNVRTTREKYIGIYKATVLSKLDYACQVYGTAKESALKRLDPVHHAGLRICTGAFRSTNVKALYVESFVPSLYDRRKLLSMSYMFGSQRISSDDRMSAWEDDLLDDRYTRLKKKPNSFGYLSRREREELGLENPGIMPFRAYTVPPWRLDRIHVCFDLGLLSKGNTNADVFRQYFGEHRHGADVEIYTDGSKMNGKVGSGVYVCGGGLNAEISRRLGDYASVFTAELVAIRVALVNLRGSGRDNLRCALYSDSRSALQALLVYNSDHNLVQDIQELVFELKQREVEVIFCWVPSHVGIKGNEVADRLAKFALGEERPAQSYVIFSDWKAHIKERLYHKWKDRWIDMVDDRYTQLRGVQDFIKKRSWGGTLTRWEDMKVTRLRTGHTRFARDFYFTGAGQPECDECGEFLTVEHLLLDCGNYYVQRRARFGIGNLTLPGLLGGNDEMLKKVLNFFKDIGFYDRI